MTNWREKVDPTLKNHLEVMVKETIKNKEAYSKAVNKGNGQLWVAIATLSKQAFNIDLRIKYLEKLIKDMLKEKAEMPISKKIVVRKTAPKKKVNKKDKKKPVKKKITKKRK